jgi:hypothetical protein
VSTALINNVYLCDILGLDSLYLENWTDLVPKCRYSTTKLRHANILEEQNLTLYNFITSPFMLYAP